MVEIISTLAILMLHAIKFCLRPIYALINYKRPPSLPPIKSQLLKLSATTLAKKIREKELSSQSVVEAYIARIKEVNVFVNAVVEDRFEAAIIDAKMCDSMLQSGEINASTLAIEKPLYGVPVTVKESCSVKGMSCTGGTLSRKGVKATVDGAAVTLLKNAGAILLLVSNTPELCTALNTFNLLFGCTRNPYDTRKSAGGSSGGEGALIGAGASVIGIGSDLSGSIRIPALFNCIFGHKPTPGIVPLTGHFPLCEDTTFQTLLVIGPLARYAEDLYLMMKILTSKCERPLRLNDPVDLKNLRVFYFDNINSFCGIKSTSSDIKQSIYKVTNYFSEIGVEVEKLSQDWVCNVQNILLSLLGELKFPSLLDIDDPERKTKALPEFIKTIFRLSKYTSALTFLQTLIDVKGYIPRTRREIYRQHREELRQKINNLLKDNGILICPAYHHPAIIPDLMFFECDCNLYSALANIAQVPSTEIPTGLNKNGMPIGVQVTSASYQDYICLAVAREFEKVFGGWIPPS